MPKSPITVTVFVNFIKDYDNGVKEIIKYNDNRYKRYVDGNFKKIPKRVINNKRKIYW